jgi:chaperonin GroEL
MRSRRFPKRNFQAPQVVFEPRVSKGLQAGFDQLVNLIRPSLGPLPHFVALENMTNRNGFPELLDCGGTIARRIIQIADRDQDVGLMYLRNVLWTLHESEGDGTATASVLFQTIYNLGHRYIAAGGDAQILRHHLEIGMRLVLTELDRQAIHLHGKRELAGLAHTLCYDDELSNLLAEIFDLIGPYGRLEVRKGHGRELDKEYVEGTYWAGGFRSAQMANTDHNLRANLETPRILASDLEIEAPEQLIPLLQLSVKQQIKQLLLVSATLSDRAASILLSQSNRQRLFVVAVKLPGSTIDTQREALEDLSILTGGRAFLKAAGETFDKVVVDDLGSARRAWADQEHFGIIGGGGDPRNLRRHVATLRAVYQKTDSLKDRERLLERLGKLMGGSATLFIGDFSASAIDRRLEWAKHTSLALRSAMRDGVVPGGGVALLACREVLTSRFKSAQDTDEHAAYEILLRAVQTPFHILVGNAGYEPGKILGEVDQCPPGYGFDVLRQKVVNMRQAGIYDVLPVVKAAVRSAISSASLALTTEVIIHRKNPPEGLTT